MNTAVGAQTARAIPVPVRQVLGLFKLRIGVAIALAALAGGFTGSMLDSLLGAVFQEKRWCEQCDRGTERAVHTCGAKTIHAGGIRGLNNDLVNFLSSIGGAAVGYLWLP